MDQSVPPETTASEPSPYEAPAILWEQEFIALAACTPGCAPDEVCVNGFCVPGGG